MQTLRMSTTCSGCGASLEDSAPFCSQCGQTVVPAAIEQPFSAPPPPPPPPPFAVAPPPPGFDVPVVPAAVPPKKSKAPLIAVAIIVVAVLVAIGVYLATKSDSDDASSTPGETYPAEVRKNFLDSCSQSSSGQDAYCECVLTQAEATYSMEEFAALEERYTKGEAQAELDQLIEPCMDLITP